MPIVLAVLSGVLAAASFPKFGTPVFAWVALSPLIVSVAISARNRSMWQRPFILGLITGVIYFGGSLYWLAATMSTYGGMPLWVGVLIAILLSSYLAIYSGVFASLLGAAVRRFGVGGIWFAPLFWVAMEWLRGWIGGGFPWVPLGASQASVIPVVQFASVVGVYGLSALVVLVGTGAAAVAVSRRRSQWIAAGIAAVTLVGVVSGGMLRVETGHLTETGQVLRVGLLQGNVAQDVKWNQAYRDPILKRYLDLSRQAIGAGAGLVIWPEASMPFFFESESSAAAPVRRLAAESRTPFIIGTDEMQGSVNGGEALIYNAAVLLGPDGKSRATYRKMQLVPFGEYVPLKRLLFFINHLVEGVSDFSAGTEPVLFDVDSGHVSVSICYESVYPWISRAFVNHGSQLLATITNDAWFGKSSAAYQHFELGAIRAVEEGRYVVRAANTGISGAVDPYGRVLLKTPLFETLTTTVDVRLLSTRTIYSVIGDVVPWFSLAVTVWFLFAARREIVRRSIP